MTRRWSWIIAAAVTAAGVYQWRRRRSASGGASDTYASGVDESSDESFPASDAPSWTPVTGPSSQH